MKRQIEILAPAGSYEGMKAAMNAGCDAVYIGGSSFGARAYANNLDQDTLLRAIDEAHIRDKKLYLTVNTLLKERELTSQLYAFIEKFYLQGLDAVIVQDVGVLHFIHEHFPELPIHASTQMTLTMAQGANLLKDYGVTRLVTSRELSLKEIKTIRENTDLEIETFVHGALCYCYSGQCFMSSLIGGRSGNRGRCAQPCRMPYQFSAETGRISSDQEKYLLSPKDISTLGIIPDLIEAGIDSFKIEGRMKRPEYTAAVAMLYRKYVDIYLESGREEYLQRLKKEEYKQDLVKLQDVYNRGGFSEGYGKTYHGKSMMSLYRPNHSGVYVGEVKEVKGSQVAIAVKEPIHAQDILEIRQKEEDGYEFTVKDPHKPGDILRTNVGKRPDTTGRDGKTQGSKGNKFNAPSIRIGDQVYRTKNNELLDYLANEYIAKDIKLGMKGYLKARTGERLSLTVSIGDCSVTAFREVVQEALKQPMTREKLIAHLEKTGETLYYFEDIQVEADDNIFIPVAWLNEIRREAINLLQEEVIKRYRRTLPFEGNNFNSLTDLNETNSINYNSGHEPMTWVSHIDNKSGEDTFGICVTIQSEEQFATAVKYPEIKAVYADYDAFTLEDIKSMATQTAASGMKFYLSLPQICRLAVFDRLKLDLLEIIDKEEVYGFVIKNFEEVSLLESLWMDGRPKKDFILNYNMYTFNQEAKAFWAEKGITHYTAPIELNYQELKNLGIVDSDMVVYGYLPLMVSTQCLYESTQGCNKGELKAKGNKDAIGFSGYLTDRLGKNFYVRTNCRSCYNTIYNGQALALHKQAQEVHGLKPRNIRLDFTKESSAQTKQVIETFLDRYQLDRYQYEKGSTKELEDYTTGHFKRGVE